MEYQETIKIKTDEFGLVNTFIGSGEQTDGYAANFDVIIWNTIDKTLVELEVVYVPHLKKSVIRLSQLSLLLITH
jgi:hypothetical protein